LEPVARLAKVAQFIERAAAEGCGPPQSRRPGKVVEQSREAEMIQAIDRLRLIHSEKRKAVYILCKHPAGHPG